jgi:GR25 family glycosyltransferase involved in LPS biosynthesis
MPVWLNPTYVSLPRDTDRARAFEAANAAQLRPGAGFRRLAATDGQGLALPAGCRYLHHKPGIRGCWDSHVRAWEGICREGGGSPAVFGEVFEDDSRLSSDYRSRLSESVEAGEAACRRGLGRPLDFLYTNRRFAADYPQAWGEPAATPVLNFASTPSWGLDAYALSSAAACELAAWGAEHAGEAACDSPDAVDLALSKKLAKEVAAGERCALGIRAIDSLAAPAGLESRTQGA